jgi:hypothetical protein
MPFSNSPRQEINTPCLNRHDVPRTPYRFDAEEKMRLPHCHAAEMKYTIQAISVLALLDPTPRNMDLHNSVWTSAH